MAFDYGTKKTGIAISETKLLYAQPLGSIKNNNWILIDKILNKWLPLHIIVGYPTHMNGKKQDITKKVDKFCNHLKVRYKIPVTIHDERLTTVEAKSIVFYNGGFKALKKTCIHAFSAKIILESWLNENKQKKR